MFKSKKNKNAQPERSALALMTINTLRTTVPIACSIDVIGNNDPPTKNDYRSKPEHPWKSGRNGPNTGQQQTYQNSKNNKFSPRASSNLTSQIPKVRFKTNCQDIGRNNKFCPKKVDSCNKHRRRSIEILETAKKQSTKQLANSRVGLNTFFKCVEEITESKYRHTYLAMFLFIIFLAVKLKDSNTLDTMLDAGQKSLDLTQSRTLLNLAIKKHRYGGGDLDRDGKISFEEFILLLQTNRNPDLERYGEEKFRVKILPILKVFDVDKDGRFNYDTFCKVWDLLIIYNLEDLEKNNSKR